MPNSIEKGLDFDVRILRKNYCGKCGSRLKIATRKYVEFSSYKAFGFLHDVKVETYTTVVLYRCEKCKYDITYKNQKMIANKQKEEGSLIISDANNTINTLRFKIKKPKIEVKENKYYVNE